jgi:hypothetical protein
MAFSGNGMAIVSAETSGEGTGVDIEQIRQVLRERGWCQIHGNGFFYNTIGNESPAGIARETKKGWELVGIFGPENDMALVTNPLVKPNLTVFRKPAPAFFTAANPWADKGPLPWLPDLTLGVESDLAHDLCQRGGHGSPGLARRFQCSCGNQTVICHYDDENARADAVCSSCRRRTTICDVQQQQSRLQQYRCDCGSKRVWIDLGIEYPVDAEGGWDFSWITVAVTCYSCRESVILFGDETA